MADHDPTREFHDELLSAYLDGELSAEERARVEERLTVDPVARQMLDDLRAVSQAVRRLPTLAVGEDLRPTILERAQQAAADVAAKPAAAPANVRAISSGDGPAPDYTFGRSRRGWFWAAAAVAAALLIAFIQRDAEQKLQHQVVADARAKHGESVDKERLAESSDRERKLAVPSGVAAAEKKSSEEPNDAFKVSKREELFDLTTDKAHQATTELNSNTAPKAAAAQNVAAADATKTDGVMRDPSRQAQAGGAANLDEHVAVSTKLPGAAARPDELAIENHPDERFRASAGASSSRGETAAWQSGKALSALERPTDLADNRPLSSASSFGAAQEPAAAGNVAAAAPLAATAPASAPIDGLLAENNGLLVVYVNVKQAAIQAHAFDAKLASNRIVLDSPVGESKSLRDADHSLTYDSFGQLKSNLQSTYGLAEVADAPAIDAVLVEASPAQVAGLLAGLDADADNVLSISVDDRQLVKKDAPIANALGVDWSKYRRVAVSDDLRAAERRLSGGGLANAGGVNSTGDLGALETQRRGAGRGGARGARGRAGGGGGRAPAPRTVAEADQGGSPAQSAGAAQSGRDLQGNGSAGQAGEIRAGGGAPASTSSDIGTGGFQAPVGGGRGGAGTGGRGAGFAAGLQTTVADDQQPLGRASRFDFALQSTPGVGQFYQRQTFGVDSSTIAGKNSTELTKDAASAEATDSIGKRSSIPETLGVSAGEKDSASESAARAGISREQIGQLDQKEREPQLRGAEHLSDTALTNEAAETGTSLLQRGAVRAASGPAEGTAGLPTANKQLAQPAPLRVLFVLRAEPTPAIAKPPSEPTSPPAADPSK